MTLKVRLTVDSHHHNHKLPSHYGAQRDSTTKDNCRAMPRVASPGEHSWRVRCTDASTMAQWGTDKLCHAIRNRVTALVLHVRPAEHHLGV